MFKKILIFILLIVILASGLILYVLNSAKATQKIMPYVFEKFVKDIKVSNLSIEKQSFDVSAALNLTNLELSALVGKDKYDLNVDSIDVKKPGLLSLDKEKIFVSLKNLRLFSKDIILKGANVTFESIEPFPAIEAIKGEIVADSIKYLGYKATDIKGYVTADSTICTVKNFRAQVYGGTLAGEIILEYKEGLKYAVKVTVKNVDIKKFEQIQPGMVSNVKGVVDGNFEINGKINGDSQIKGSLWSVRGGEIKAALLKLLLDYIPQSVQRKEIDALIKSDGNLPLDSAVVTIDTLKDDKFLTKFKIKSKKINLDVNLDLELNIEGGLKNLLNIQKQYL